MATLRKLIEDFEHRVGERVESVAVGVLYDPANLEPMPPTAPIGRDEAMALPLIDREYAGWMGCDVHPHLFYAWTASWVLFLSGENGGAGPSWVPRHPTRCVPDINGTDEYS